MLQGLFRLEPSVGKLSQQIINLVKCLVEHQSFKVCIFTFGEQNYLLTLFACRQYENETLCDLLIRATVT